MSAPAGRDREQDRRRDGETTLRSGLQGIGYVVLMSLVVGLVGFLLAVVVSLVY